MYSTWNNIYNIFNPVAFNIFGLEIHWYGIAYVLSLLISLYIAKVFIKKDAQRFPISNKNLESFFIWVEIGVILGARIGYIAIYEPNSMYYFLHPWQIFNPFDIEGHFVGIRGMSYHGALVGFLIASIAFAYKKKQNFLLYMDLVAISVPLGYVFGRIGNFLNQELYGRIVPSTSVWGQKIGILVNGELRYPSQLIEAFLEGLVVFIVVLIAKKLFKTRGLLIVVYAITYGVMRFIAEFYREPDPQMGYYFGNLSMGQILSLVMIVFALGILAYIKKNKNAQN
ncbi:prolipoprotein diacylglyceryl transferase [Helicobacter cappadocius]|uniref:Phosphatidylglycerol--prolipoprotein diacylglyceryl transferase n=1 Tax=Helicobacter cappadocius TaxID=3063998 RepID=A0AA90PZG5_9HELI|nr:MULTISPECIES: prolipoprotein diacylglyceryl transferase [unclassified Helicobacter]MDO7253461.1 prolipoprotein diacylglyceryl transferase [Helicobacter sp. faydin-H75]MDP2539388.1 prolipoprotein diacylglyceryl transferase [Helicobacter sp. faydin-H76]